MPDIELSFFSSNMTFLKLFLQANILVKLVMSTLFISSIWCWGVILDKLISYAKTRRHIRIFEKMFWSGQNLEELYRQRLNCRVLGIEAIFMAAMREWKKSFEKGVCSSVSLQMRLDKAMDVALAREVNRMEAHLSVLATVGSVAPFIGLLGTVIGIMTSFESIAISKNTSLALVAPGVSEALLATAIGLFTAIPAVIAYNKFKTNANSILSQLEGFADEFSSILSRQIDERLAIRQAKS
ncbi:MAG: biopolymer transport protein TolQ [Candidatus Tokpelaia sp. JSC161]|jgi:biopolymer transport protein TolQ|nr:MAG: biopolymer transport protein TolQ [Candidatus Tokpelaia sp. JSC161]